MGKAPDGAEVLDAKGEVWQGAKVFVTTSTSGLAASLVSFSLYEVYV
jgi:hypothetical protein